MTFTFWIWWPSIDIRVVSPVTCHNLVINWAKEARKLPLRFLRPRVMFKNRVVCERRMAVESHFDWDRRLCVHCWTVLLVPARSADMLSELQGSTSPVEWHRACGEPSASVPFLGGAGGMVSRGLFTIPLPVSFYSVPLTPQMLVLLLLPQILFWGCCLLTGMSVPFKTIGYTRQWQSFQRVLGKYCQK